MCESQKTKGRLDQKKNLTADEIFGAIEIIKDEKYFQFHLVVDLRQQTRKTEIFNLKVFILLLQI